MGKNLQSKAEELVYNAIDNISEELEIDCKVHPKVYYIHRGSSFDELELPEEERESFDFTKKFGQGVYLYKQKTILLPSLDSIEIYEEAGHFLHFDYSGLTFEGKGKFDELFLKIIIESIGYFCSKIGDSSRIPLFSSFPDYYDNRKEYFKKVASNHLDPGYVFVYQQGYGLGENMFNHYLSGLLSKEEIRDLISKKFEGKYEASLAFIKLKHLFDKDFFFWKDLEKLSQFK